MDKLKKEIDRIRGRLHNATPGPWICGASHMAASSPIRVVQRFDGDRAATLSAVSMEDATICAVGPGELNQTLKKNNADFIAHAPTDIARLLAEVERLREGLVAIADMRVGFVAADYIDVSRKLLDGDV